jgi:formate hydrogenlyase transcriptional activator
VIVSSAEAGEMEARIRRFDGEYRWFLIRAVPKRDETGDIVNWYGSNVDIEDRKRTEEQLRQSETELEQIVDTIAQLVIFLRPDGSALHANTFVFEYTGLSPKDVQEEDFRERVFHPEDVERLREERKQALLRGLPFQNEQRVRRHDGAYRWFLIRYSAVLDPQGSPVRWYAAGIDIDDRKQVEERTQSENFALREEIIRSSMFEEIVGSSAVLRKVLTNVEKVAPSQSTVLILGETGTGKELIARAIHRMSNRSTKAFIRINCAAIPASLIASELFGHEKGAFTGAIQRRIGRFEVADGGTIFLDEIGDLPAETQIALLRVLQEREFERVGSSQPVRVDVRVVAASNRNLKADVAAGTFRQDLFYRLNVFPIQVPSLRERLDDVPLLLEYLVERYAKNAGKRIRTVSKKTLELLQAYDWPGNIRELQNVVERAVLLCEDDVFVIDEAWLKRDVPPTPSLDDGYLASGPLSINLEDRERQMIESALSECNGQVSGPNGAAAKLGMPRQTLDSRIASLSISKQRFKAQ